MFKLIIQDDEGKTTVVPLIRDEITIGRKEGNTIRLTERNVSRRHARILKQNGAVLLEDLDSYNGVKLNGARVQGRISVNEADRITIGDYVLELKVDHGAQVEPHLVQDTYDASAGAPARVHGAPPPVPPPAASHQTAIVNLNQLGARPNAAFTPAVAEPTAAPLIASPGRLVIVSQNLAGREFALDRPEMVIGRTDENDVVVDHRSISRHHAKIVQEGGRYAIVDLGSANGVRVNGEEYGKVELRRGDVIELGHVHLRYVDPGEDFVFERDATIVDLPGTAAPRKRKGALIAGVSVAVVVGIVAVVLLARGGGSADEEQLAGAPSSRAAKSREGTVAAAATSSAAAPAPSVPAMPLPTPPAASPASAQVAAAHEAMAAERWTEAANAAEAALQIDPANAEAQAVRDRARAEMAAQVAFTRFMQAKDAGNVADAAKLYRTIPEDSAYRIRGEATYDAMRDAWVLARTAEVRGLVAKGKCAQASALANDAAKLFPETKDEMAELAGACSAPVAARDATRPERPSGKSARAAPSEEELAATLREAKDAAKSLKFGEAKRKADQVLRARPGDQEALTIAGISACRMNDRSAGKYIARLKGERHDLVKRICVSNGVAVDR